MDVIGAGHDEENCVEETEPPLGSGIILQREIQYFRDGRGGLDVIAGEVLPAYVEEVREDGWLHVSLRPPGGLAKTTDLSGRILEALREGGEIGVGDKSSPEEISNIFPGTSKGAFKKAVSALYKKRMIVPGPYSTQLVATSSSDGGGNSN